MHTRTTFDKAKERYEMSEKTLSVRKKRMTRGTKYLLDFMFWGGIVVTLTLPVSLRWIGNYLDRVRENYLAALVVYFILGIFAVLLINELRRIFHTVLQENCFVEENVASLRKMGDISFIIAAFSLVRCFFYMTMAMAVVILVFVVAGLFSKVLALVFEEAVRYKEENDLTI